MNTPMEIQKRVLAVDPSARGLRFALLEGPQSLIGWGGSERTGKTKNAAALLFMESLIESYQPDIIVMEDCRDKECKRCPRVRRLLQAICRLARKRRIRVRHFSVRIVRAALSGSSTSTKHQIATIIAERFPELVPRLPPVRKSWKSEANRMGIFDAMALALTFFSER
jgi:Holliday junction resolvasome RuvABC endonuclease subunit